MPKAGNIRYSVSINDTGGQRCWRHAKSVLTDRTIGDHGDKHATIKVPSTRLATNSQAPVGQRYSDMQLNPMIERVIL